MTPSMCASNPAVMQWMTMSYWVKTVAVSSAYYSEGIICLLCSCTYLGNAEFINSLISCPSTTTTSSTASRFKQNSSRAIREPPPNIYVFKYLCWMWFIIYYQLYLLCMKKYLHMNYSLWKNKKLKCSQDYVYSLISQ